MKNLFIAFFIVLTFSICVNGKFAILPLDERVKNSDLIVIGTLESVSEYKTKEIDYSKGILIIEKILSGDIKTIQGFQLKSGDKVLVEWQNSNMFACRFGFPENEKGIWFLQLDNEGKIESLSPSSNASLSDLAEVKKHLKKQGLSNETAKIVKTQNINEQKPQIQAIEKTSEIINCSLYSEKSKEKKYFPFQAFLVILASISLYYLFYRSRFKIR